MNFDVKELFIYDNKMVKEFILKNDYIEASFINIGASITNFIDLNSKRNVVLRYNDYKMYKANPNYFGCVVGRNAGRIENSTFKLNDKEIILTKNFLEKHQLHSGFNGFQTKYFDETINTDSITFTALSEDGEEGFSGKVRLMVTYKLIKDELHLIYEAVSDYETVINITNHTYFNLNENKEEPILNHKLTLNADEMIQLDSEMIPKKVISVNNTPFDFKEAKLVANDIDDTCEQIKIGNGYDHPFIINKTEEINHVATLCNDEVTLNVYSNQDAVVVYSSNFLDGTTSIQKEQKANHRCAICLETQGIPNSMNIKEFNQRNLYKEDEVYKQTTIWKLNSK